MTVATIVIAEFMDDDAVKSLSARMSTFYEPDLVEHPAKLRGVLADAKALIIRNRTRVDEALLAAAPRLEYVGRLGVGLDNIDLPACKERGIAVYPATGANDEAVAEYVATAALILLRPAFFGSAAVAAGAWPRNRSIGSEIAGRRAGLIGFGQTARKTADRLSALGMTILAHDPMLTEASIADAGAMPCRFEELLAAADLVSLHVPLTARTRYLIDARALDLMKHQAVLVNAARGGVVDEVALCSALRRGAIAGAALDVFEEEPLSPASGKLFENVPSLILTPHIAGVTLESNVRVSAMIAETILRALEPA